MILCDTLTGTALSGVSTGRAGVTPALLEMTAQQILSANGY